MDKYYDTLSSDYGDIAIIANNDGLIEVAFQQGKAAACLDNCILVSNTTNLSSDSNTGAEFVVNAKQQLKQYFAGERRVFDLPLAQQGTNFQKTVWHALTTIEMGQTKSYGDLANIINNPKAVRAVGTANGSNKIAIIVPCHRVIGKDKKLTGYAGGIGIKAKLLMHEKAYFKV